METENGSFFLGNSLKLALRWSNIVVCLLVWKCLLYFVYVYIELHIFEGSALLTWIELLYLAFQVHKHTHTRTRNIW